MRRSKLEMYIDILQVLAQRGQLKTTHIMYKSNVNCQVLKTHLEFLAKNNLIEERTLKKQKTTYAITPKGITTLKAFKQVKQAFHLEEEENRITLPF